MRHGDATGMLRVLKLPVASFRRNARPPGLLQRADEIPGCSLIENTRAAQSLQPARVEIERRRLCFYRQRREMAAPDDYGDPMAQPHMIEQPSRRAKRTKL